VHQIGPLQRTVLPAPLLSRDCGVSLVEELKIRLTTDSTDSTRLLEIVAAQSLKENMSFGQCLLNSRDALA
jgi:hypothetical protein